MEFLSKAQEILRNDDVDFAVCRQIAQAYLDEHVEVAALRRRFQDEVAINADHISNLCRDLQIPIRIGGPWWDLVKQRVAYFESELERERALRAKLEAALLEIAKWPNPKPGAGQGIGALYGAGMYAQYDIDRSCHEGQIAKLLALCDEAKR